MRITENESGLTPDSRQYFLYRYFSEHSSKDHVVKPTELVDFLGRVFHKGLCLYPL